jgi:hypothetical protein
MDQLNVVTYHVSCNLKKKKIKKLYFFKKIKKKLGVTIEPRGGRN